MVWIASGTGLFGMVYEHPVTNTIFVRVGFAIIPFLIFLLAVCLAVDNQAQSAKPSACHKTPSKLYIPH